MSTHIGDYVRLDEFNNPIAVSTFYCSKGEFQYTDPLPAYVPDMQNFGYTTRHCCEQGTFWNPLTEFCEEGEFCYNPNEPLELDCNYDFSTEFELWAGDVYNPDFDCINQENAEQGLPVTACCPINIYAIDNYDYVNVFPYVVS